MKKHFKLKLDFLEEELYLIYYLLFINTVIGLIF